MQVISQAIIKFSCKLCFFIVIKILFLLRKYLINHPDKTTIERKMEIIMDKKALLKMNFWKEVYFSIYTFCKYMS